LTIAIGHSAKPSAVVKWKWQMKKWQMDHFSIFSFLATHSFHPPSMVFTLVTPKAFMSSAARALVASATQAQ
jgi:hypothetical protein